MALLQPITDLVHLCNSHGITRAVLSPGSRSAAITLAFARNPAIACTVVMDERAAGFIALGMAQQLQMPVALVCTSGSAAYNFAPAVAEAFFQQIPLLVLTADRPPEWIHQNDGQTIYQEGIYGKHVKAAFNLPPDYSNPDPVWFINRTVNEALLLLKEVPCGPVHLNIPIREPFYPEPDEKVIPSREIRTIFRTESERHLPTTAWHQLQDEWESSERILIAVGQHTAGLEMGASIKRIAEEFQVPVLGDVISNLPTFDTKITKQDLFLGDFSLPELQPDLLITTGQSFISKQFKQFLRKNPPHRHWHISVDPKVIDTFQTLTTHIPVQPEYFFSKLFEDLDYQRFVQNDDEGPDEEYLGSWMAQERRTRRNLRDFLANLTSLTDLSAVEFVVKNITQAAQLHLANSMPVRYVNLLGIDNQFVKIFCNRGTSGIDGCVSTAIGAAMVTREPVYLLVGDVAFFYDRNGLLVDALPQNLKIILLNNAGGTIFRMLDGSAAQPELERYFETRHSFTAKRTAEDSNITYYQVDTLSGLQSSWNEFVVAPSTALLEINTDSVESVKLFKEVKAFVREST